MRGVLDGCMDCTRGYSGEGVYVCGEYREYTGGRVDRRLGGVKTLSGGYIEKSIAYDSEERLEGGKRWVENRYRIGEYYWGIEEYKVYSEGRICFHAYRLVYYLQDIDSDCTDLLGRVGGERVERILGDSLQCMQMMEGKGMVHGHISPKMIVSKKGGERYMLAEDINYSPQSIRAGLYDTRDIMLSPEGFDQVQADRGKKRQESGGYRPTPKGDVFSLGMSMLAVATGCPVHKCYGLSSSSMDIGLLGEYTKEMIARLYAYPGLVNTILSMLTIKETDRPSFSQIFQRGWKGIPRLPHTESPNIANTRRIFSEDKTVDRPSIDRGWVGQDYPQNRLLRHSSSLSSIPPPSQTRPIPNQPLTLHMHKGFQDDRTGEDSRYGKGMNRSVSSEIFQCRQGSIDSGPSPPIPQYPQQRLLTDLARMYGHRHKGGESSDNEYGFNTLQNRYTAHNRNNTTGGYIEYNRNNTANPYIAQREGNGQSIPGQSVSPLMPSQSFADALAIGRKYSSKHAYNNILGESGGTGRRDAVNARGQSSLSSPQSILWPNVPMYSPPSLY
mgnify:CR=1 FL=1